ncbi:MAG: beta-propeller fold lactonase family protein, partial [Flavitalea sp.]
MLALSQKCLRRYAATILLLITSFSLRAQFADKDHYRLLIGGYTKAGKSDGIYVYDFNVKDGSFSFVSQVRGIVNPSYLTVTRDGKKVYAVNEAGKGKQRICAFNFNAVQGSLELVNSVSSGGSGPNGTVFSLVARDTSI